MTSDHHELHIDLETYSGVSIKDAGVYRYVEDPDFHILMLGYAFDDEPVQVIDLMDELDMSVGAHNEYPDDPAMQMGYILAQYYPRLTRALLDSETTVVAQNAVFERICLSRTFGQQLPPDKWKDTMIMAYEAGLPGSLDGVTKALGFEEDKQKDKTGKELIRYFCQPCKPTKANGGRTRNLPEHAPEKWAQFLEYNRQDVVAEREVYKALLLFDPPESEWSLWRLDQKMNDRGVRIDIQMVQNIIDFGAVFTDRELTRAKELTGLQNPNSLAQLKAWFAGYGLEVSSITKDTIPKIEAQISNMVTEGDLSQDEGNRMLDVLDIRKALGKTSTAKYTKMLGAVCSDDRLKGILQFYGASRTGRWAGRIVQVHNLPQNKLEDIDYARELAADNDFEMMEDLFPPFPFVASQLVRTAFIPSPGCRFCVADFAAIEARVIAWLSGEEWRQAAFREGKDIYCESASMMFKVPVVKHGVNGHLRQKGKIAELALGYGGNVNALKAFGATEMGIPEDELPHIVRMWRDASPKICAFWTAVETAAKRAIKTRVPQRLKCGIRFEYHNRVLSIRLPSGRTINYWGARVGDYNGKESLMYQGTLQATGKWGELETWGGKLVENIVQAVARDCLAETIRRVTAAGYNIVMHVHDEIICDVPIEDTHALKTITDLMGAPIDWAPGLLLRGDGYECDFYKKD